jgi:hypothetical protein
VVLFTRLRALQHVFPQRLCMYAVVHSECVGFCIGAALVYAFCATLMRGDLFADPPSFPNATVSLSEFAPGNAPAGTPLNATHTAPDVSVSYAIVGGNGSALFKVGLCDGQVRLLTAGTLDFNVANVYELIVEATPDGISTSAVNATVTILVLYENKVGCSRISPGLTMLPIPL